MKTLSRFELILIALIAIIGFAFFKFVSANSAKQYDANSDLNHEQIQSGPIDPSGTHQPKTKPKAQSARQIQSDLESNCDKICLTELSNALTKNGKISADMMSLILDDPVGFAQYLKSKPEIISPLLQSLNSDETEDNYTRRAAQAIYDALSGSEKHRLAKDLLDKESPENRLVGLDLIATAIDSQPNAVTDLNRIIGYETNAVVLTRALNLSAALPHDVDAQATLDALSEIIRHNPNDHFAGHALIAKVSLSQTSEPIHQDILASLTSYSIEKNASALTSLEFAMDKFHTEFEQTGGWRNDATIKKAVISLSENENIPEDTRLHAIKLRTLYFD